MMKKTIKNYVMMSYLFSKKYEILDKDSFHEYPMNIFLGCISELIKKQDIENKEDKKRIIKKIIKYINQGGFIEVSKKYKNGSGHVFSLQGYIEIEEKRNIFYFSIINPHRVNDTLIEEEFSEENIKELNSVSYEKQENKDDFKN